MISVSTLLPHFRQHDMEIAKQARARLRIVAAQRLAFGRKMLLDALVVRRRGLGDELARQRRLQDAAHGKTSRASSAPGLATNAPLSGTIWMTLSLDSISSAARTWCG
jgi:hypothetical protein